jgi:hypothetical protein
MLDLYLWHSQLAEWQYTFADDALRTSIGSKVGYPGSALPGGRKGKL